MTHCDIKVLRVVEFTSGSFSDMVPAKLKTLSVTTIFFTLAAVAFVTLIFKIPKICCIVKLSGIAFTVQAMTNELLSMKVLGL